MAWTKLIELDRCRENAGTFVECGALELAVFVLTEPDCVEVIDNSCPHASGNLAGGPVTDGVVSCPWHSWAFDLSTGVCTNSPTAKVRRYESEVRDGAVWADV